MYEVFIYLFILVIQSTILINNLDINWLMLHHLYSLRPIIYAFEMTRKLMHIDKIGEIKKRKRVKVVLVDSVTCIIISV